jgi:hypothetical protein
MENAERSSCIRDSYVEDAFMIHRLERYRAWVSRFLVALIVVAAVAKDHVFEAATNLGTHVEQVVLGEEPQVSNVSGQQGSSHRSNNGANNLLAIVILVILYAVLEIAAEFSISKVGFIRRAIMGSSDIEGCWLDIVFQSDQIISGGFVIMYYDEEGKGYRVEGRDFDVDGIWKAWFTTEITRYDNETLSYKYRAVRPGVKVDGTGHGQFNFSSDNKGMTHYLGYFYEDRNNRRFYVYGERLSTYIPNRRERRRRSKPDQLAALVTQFIKDRKGVLPIHKGAIVNAVLEESVVIVEQGGAPEKSVVTVELSTLVEESTAAAERSAVLEENAAAAEQGGTLEENAVAVEQCGVLENSKAPSIVPMKSGT